MKKLRWLCLALILGLPGSATSNALPSFARQMDTLCIQCHTEFPILTEFGRQFKLSGYTMSAGTSSDFPPIAMMLQPSFTWTEKGQARGAAPGFGNNDNIALSQASVFYSGRLFGPYADHLLSPDVAGFLDHFGLFDQVTYNGAAKAWGWDNADLRYASAATLSGHAVTDGLYLNNNPTMQDPWNTLPAWGFPFSNSQLAPTPAAGTMIDGALAQEVAGLGAYAMIDNSIYLDFGLYRTLSAGFQKAVGVDPTGETTLSGAAPYWRLAWQKAVDNGATFEAGTFGMEAGSFPGGDHTAGRDTTVDYGLDSEFQKPAGKNDFEALLTLIEEYDKGPASQALGGAANVSDHLTEYKFTLTDLYDKTYSVSAQYFITAGRADALRYTSSANGSPLSDGAIFQLDYLPINQHGGPAFWPRSNLKVSLQYVWYNRYNGTRTNFDGAGGNARDNNTLYLETWIDF
ncbi:MAG TPA: hypothetical protein VGL42_06210 [Opitutaceae bacterium]